MEIIKSSESFGERPSSAEWALAIRETYGTIMDFSQRFNVQTQKYCLSNTEGAIANNLPPFSRIIGAYGARPIESILRIHVAETVVRIGEERDVDEQDVAYIAEAICQCEPARYLCFPSIFGFFYLLKTGEYKIYGRVTPLKIMEAFREFVRKQREREIKIREELEWRRENIKKLKEQAAAIPPNQLPGIKPGESIVDYFQRKIQEEREREEEEKKNQEGNDNEESQDDKKEAI